jgi:hypothetical protein
MLFAAFLLLSVVMARGSGGTGSASVPTLAVLCSMGSLLLGLSVGGVGIFVHWRSRWILIWVPVVAAVQAMGVYGTYALIMSSEA